MIVVLFLAIVATVTSAPSSHTFSLQNDGTYNFFFDTGKDGGSHSRSETRNQDGVVVGKYSYEDPNGDMRVVNYRAGDFGYVANGDVGVAGAPESQLPADDKKDTKKEEVNSGNEDTKEDKTETTNEVAVDVDEDDNEDEDIKAMKLPEPSDDGPPEGFPVGFFGPFFQGLRRLPEPTKEEPIETTVASNETPEEKPKDSPAKKAFVLPFTSFVPRAWIPPVAYAPSFHHHPAYSYSYSHPMSHGHGWSF